MDKDNFAMENSLASFHTAMLITMGYGVLYKGFTAFPKLVHMFALWYIVLYVVSLVLMAVATGIKGKTIGDE